MGRIKTDMVKRTTSKLVKAHPEKFSKNFDENKKALADLAEIRSKKLRNVIAGYAVRLKTLGEDRRPTRKKPSFGRGGPRRFGQRPSYGNRPAPSPGGRR